MAATGWRRWRASGGSRWRCCRASAARTTRGWRRSRRCARPSRRRLLACFREGGPENMRGAGRAARRAGRRRRGAGRGAAGAAGRGLGADGRLLAIEAAEPPRGRWCRSCSTARCCSPTMRRRSAALAEALEARGDRGAAGLRAEPAGRRRRRAAGGGAAAAGAGGARDGDGLRGVGRRRHALRPAGGAGAAGGAGDDAARGLGGRARAGWRRPIWRCTWCCRSSTGGCWPGRSRSSRWTPTSSRVAGEPARAGPGGAGGAADRGAGAAAGDAAGGAAAGGADPGLSGGGGADRLCGRARRAGERAGDARATWRRRATRSGRCRRRRGS